MHTATRAGTLRLRRCTAARAEFEQQLVRLPAAPGGEKEVCLTALATVVWLSPAYRPTRIPAHVRALLERGESAE